MKTYKIVFRDKSHRPVSIQADQFIRWQDNIDLYINNEEERTPEGEPTLTTVASFSQDEVLYVLHEEVELGDDSD